MGLGFWLVLSFLTTGIFECWQGSDVQRFLFLLEVLRLPVLSGRTRKDLPSHLNQSAAYVCIHHNTDNFCLPRHAPLAVNLVLVAWLILAIKRASCILP